MTTADLALLTDFQGIPPELRGPLALVLVQKEFARLQASLGSLQRSLGLATGLGNRVEVAASLSADTPGPTRDASAFRIHMENHGLKP